MTIRPASGRDADAVADILRGTEGFDRLRAEPRDRLVARVAAYLDGRDADGSRTLLVAEGADGEVAGYVAVHWMPNLITGLDGIVSELFVHTRSRGCGVGSRLLTEVRAEGDRRGAGRLMLVNLRERESYRRGFYAKQGWEERSDMALFTFRGARTEG